MSKTIENNVVQMTFDNKDFEKNISTSSKSIEKLNEQLKFKDASKGFKDIEKYANEVNFDGLNKAISNINSVFTVTGNLTKKVIDDIAGYFERKIANAVSSVSRSVNYVFDPGFGVQKYEQYTTALLSMTSNLADYDKLHFKENFGTELEFVEHYIETLALYADETSYSMTDMVDTMAKFAANNVPIEKSSSAMMGLANMAAVAGQNAKTATASMYQLAQAFGTGYVRYQDWAQAFTLKNIATKESKEIFLKAAMEMHTIDQDDIAAAKKALGEENWMNYFFTSDSLNEGWLKTDTVLVKGLQEYSKASDLILANLDEIGDLSVSQILSFADDMKKSGKSATAFVNDISGASMANVDNVELLIETLDKLGSKEYELSLKAFMAAQNATNFHEALEATRDAVGTKMMYALKYFIGDLDQARKLWTKFANSLWDVFAAPLDNALAGLKIWNKGVEEVNEGFLKTIDFEDDYEKFWKSVGRIFTNVGAAFDGLIDDFRILAGCFIDTKDGMETTSIIAEYTLDFMKGITRAVGDLADATEEFLESDLYLNIKIIFMNIIKTVRNTKRIVGSLFEATVGTILKNIGGPLTAISEILIEISKRFEMWSDRILRSNSFKQFIDTLSKLTAKVMELGTYLIGKFGNILLKIIDNVFALAVKIANFLSPAIEALLDFVMESVVPFIDKVIDGQYGLGDALDWVGEKLDKVIPKLEDFTKKVFGMDFKEIEKKFSSFADNFILDVKKIGSEGFDKLKEFFKGSFDKNVKGSWTALFDAVTEADSVSDAAQNAIRWSGDAIMRPIQLVIDIASLIVGKDLDGMSEAISKFIHSITNSLADISPNVFKFISKVVNLLFDVVKYVVGLVTEIIKFISGSASTTGFALLDDFIYSIKTILSSLIEAFVYLLKQLAEIAPLITPAIKNTIDWMGDVLMNIAHTFKEKFGKLAEIKSSDDFLRYAKTLLKMVLGIWLIIKIFTMVDTIAFTFKKFKYGRRSIKRQLFVVTDAVGGLFDSLAGWDLPGLLRMFAIVVASIGYAMGNIAKVGEMLSDPKTRKGMIVAFLAVIGLFVLMEHLVKSLMKTNTKLTERLVQFKTKMGWGKFGDPDDKGMHGTLTGVATMLIGLGIALIGISSAIGILAKVSKTSSPSDLYSAVAGVAFILLALGLFLKLAAAQQKSSRSLGDEGVYKSNKEGKFYKGVASALIGFAVAVLLMTPAIALLTHTVKSAGVDNFKEAVHALLSILGIIGIAMALTVAASQQAGFWSSVGIVGVLKAMSGLMITMAVLMAGLSLTMAYLINKTDRADVFKLLEYFNITLGIIAALVVILSANARDITWKQQLASLAIKIGKLIVISTILTGLAMVLGAIAGSIYMLVRLLKKYNFTSGKIPDIIATAILIIIAIMFVLTVMIKSLARAMNFDKGDWRAIIAKSGGLFLMLLAMSNMLVIISGIATLMAYILSFKRVGDNIWNAVKVMGAILGGLTLFLYLMMGIGKLAGGLTEKVKGGDAALELIKIAMAIAVVSAAIGVMAGVFIILAKSIKNLDTDAISDAFWTLAGLMTAITIFALALGVINVYFGGVITVLAGLFKALAIVILGVIAAVVLFGAYGDKISEWLYKARPKITAGFKALGKAMVAAIDGFNEALPLVLDGLSKTLLIILAWIAYNIQDWTFYIILILANLLNGIGEALEDEGSEIGQALGKILNGLLTIVMSFLDEVLGSNITGWFGGLIGSLGDILMYSMPILGQMMAAADADRREDEKIKEFQHQKDMYEMRRKGAVAYMEILENLQNAENELVQASEITDEVTKAQMMRKASENVAGWQAKVDSLQKDAEFIFGKYGVDVTKSADAQSKWWEGDDDISVYNNLLKSKDWSQGFDWNNRIGAEHDSTWYNNLNPHSTYVRQEPVAKEETETETKAQTTDVAGMIMDKIQNGSTSFAKTATSIFTGRNSGEGSTGSIIGGDILDTLKEKGSSALSGIKSGMSDFLGIGTEGGIADFFGVSQFTSSVPQYNLDTAVPVTSMTGYGMQVPDVDSIYQNADLSGGVIDSNYDTAYANEQLNGLSNTMTGNTDDVVNAINDQKQAYIDALAEYTQAIIEKTYEIKLNNDVVAGELAPSLDKALGRIQAMKQKRGV